MCYALKRNSRNIRRSMLNKLDETIQTGWSFFAPILIKKVTQQKELNGKLLQKGI